MSSAVPPSVTSTVGPSATSSGGTAGRILGAVLLLPALGAVVGQYLVPGVLTAIGSLQSMGLQDSRPFVGLTNYQVVAAVLPGGLSLAVALSVVAGTIGVTGGLLGSLAARGGAVPRRITAAIAGVLVTLYAPVGMAVALRHDDLTVRAPLFGLLVTAALVWLPPVLAGGTLVGLLTGRPGGTRSRALLVAGLVGVIASAGVGLQAMARPVVPLPDQDGAVPLQTSAYLFMFTRFDFGAALALETVALVTLGLLGIAATCVVVVGRLRLELTGPTATRGSGISWLGVAGLGVGLVVVLLVHRGWLAGLVAPAGPDLPPSLTTRWMVNTWMPSLGLAVTQVVLAGLAGFAIGWLRPAGRRSPWLLLAFAPWLLVGAAPLVPQHVLVLLRTGLFRTWASLLPPTWVSLPAVIAFTLLFGALGDAHRAARAGGSAATTASGIRVGAAATVLIGSVLWLTAAQSLPWAWATRADTDQFTGPVALLHMAAMQPVVPSLPTLPQWISTPIPVVLVLAAIIATAAVLTTDRLALVADAGPTPEQPMTDLGHGPATQQAHPTAPPAVPGRDRHGADQG